MKIEKWKEELKETLSRFILRGDYKSGVRIAEQFLKKYPKDFFSRYQYAKLLGDWSDELPLKKRKELKKKATQILFPLTKSMRGVDAITRFGVCVNYYYQSYEFKSMYVFGKRFAKYDKQKSFYAQGLGAALEAMRLFDQNKINESKKWAFKAKIAWEKYNLKKEKYYFAHYNYAKALALVGDSKAAKHALNKAAKLSRRPVTDWEFADVLNLIENRN